MLNKEQQEDFLQFIENFKRANREEDSLKQESIDKIINSNDNEDINNFKLECIEYLHTWDTQDYQFNHNFIVEEFDNYIFELNKIGA
jgi:hypothetical protein